MAGVVVLIILVSGVLDIGRAFMTFVAIENGAGEGALFASVHPTWVSHGVPYADANDPNNITYRAAHESPSGLVDWNLATVEVITSTIEAGQPITVTVTYSYTVLTPFINQLIGGGNLPLRAEAVEMILNTDD
jgi:Flp pilus assembly protein TadG